MYMAEFDVALTLILCRDRSLCECCLIYISTYIRTYTHNTYLHTYIHTLALCCLYTEQGGLCIIFDKKRSKKKNEEECGDGHT